MKTSAAMAAVEPAVQLCEVGAGSDLLPLFLGEGDALHTEQPENAVGLGPGRTIEITRAALVLIQFEHKYISDNR